MSGAERMECCSVPFLVGSLPSCLHSLPLGAGKAGTEEDPWGHVPMDVAALVTKVALCKHPIGHGLDLHTYGPSLPPHCRLSVTEQHWSKLDG